MKIYLPTLLFSLLLLSSCSTLRPFTPKQDDQNALVCGFTTSFNVFINQTKYATYQFQRPDLECGSYGGKSFVYTVVKTPIVFIHDALDIGFGLIKPGNIQTGFRKLANYFTSQGYEKSELYTTTWGVGNTTSDEWYYHSRENVIRVMKFIEAVSQYTQEKIVVIGHRMGVTLARRALKGGNFTDRNGTYNIGEPLTAKIKSLIGLGGLNRGAHYCDFYQQSDPCSSIDGMSVKSAFLKELNDDKTREAAKIYSVWGLDDFSGDVVDDRITGRIDGQDGEVKDADHQYTYDLQFRDLTGPAIINWV